MYLNNNMDIELLREEFPQLSQTVYSKPLVYLDNAATSLRPRSVIDKWTELSVKYNSNLHRAVHRTASIATQEYENTRDAVASFINASDSKEIVFTSGTTASVNLLAFSFGEAFIEAGDEVLVCESEHHSNLIPWQMMCARKSAKLKVLPVDEKGHISLDQLESLISPNTKILAIAHISNVLGLVNPVKDIVRVCHSKGCKVFIDGAQSIVHTKIDVQDIDCDFFAFSGHKLFAAPGTGVLYGKKELLEQLPPYMGGGEMIATVHWDKSTYAPVPQKFEAGTQNIAGTPTLSVAMQLADSMRVETIEENLENITGYMLEQLSARPAIRLYGIPDEAYKKIPLFSFSVEHIHHEDLALILDKMGIALRSGQMCAEPLMDRYGVTGMLRASFAQYNTIDEAKFFISSLDKAIKMLEV